MALCTLADFETCRVSLGLFAPSKPPKGKREKVSAASGNGAVAYYAGNKTMSCEHTSTC